MTYAEVFATLANEWSGLADVEETIAAARAVMPSNQQLQLEMDRQQARVDQNRARIVEFVAINAILN